MEILGHINDPGVDILSIVRAYGLPVEFDPKVMTQVEHVAKPVSKQEYGRTHGSARLADGDHRWRRCQGSG